MKQEIQTVPFQRIVSVNKAPTDKNNLYTPINLQALGYAVNDLQSKAGIKLWLYIGQNTNKYTFALSSKDFCEWAGCSRTAYTTAFEELVKYNYLIPYSEEKNRYKFIEQGNHILKEKPQQPKPNKDGFVF